MSEASARYPESLRAALPRDESYPLSRSEIDAALLSHGVEQIDMICFLSGQRWWTDGAGTVIEAYFRAVGEYPERLELRVFSISARLKPTIAAAVKIEPLNEVAAWIADAGRAEIPWRSTDHRLTFRWVGNALRREDLDGLRARPW